MVFCCGVLQVYVSARCWNHWNFPYTVNTCMVCLLCGFSCERPDIRNDEMPCRAPYDCMVSPHCEFCCAQQDMQPVWILCYKHYIQTVSLQNDFVCVSLDHCYCDNICHILCTCIYQCEYSCDISVHSVMKSISHTEYINISVQCVFSCDYTVHPVITNFSHIHCMNTCIQECIALWVCLCLLKFPFHLNRLSHTIHKYGLGLSTCLVISSVLISNGWDLSVLSASVSNSVELPAYTQHANVKQ